MSALLRRAIVTRGFLELLNVRWRQLRAIDLQRQLVERAGELERHLVIVGHRCAGIGPDVEVFIPLHDERDSVFHGLARHLLAVDLEYTGAAAADAAHVVEGERTEAEAVIFEIEFKRVLARRQRVRCLPARALYIEEIVQEPDWSPAGSMRTTQERGNFPGPLVATTNHAAQHTWGHMPLTDAS
jgi:hypothetical protein